MLGRILGVTLLIGCAVQPRAARPTGRPYKDAPTAVDIATGASSVPAARPPPDSNDAGPRKRRYHLDSKFVVTLLESVRDLKTQYAIAYSPAFAYLPPPVFRRFLFHFWPVRRGNAWRWTLGRTLSSFLHENPEEAHFYAQAIWTLANDPNETVALAGLASTNYQGNTLTVKDTKRLVPR